MMMLAQGGYIVGKMATMLYPEGIEVVGSTTESLLKTKEYIQNCDSITLFEPTFEFNQRLSRIDIFVKNGNNIQLIEVKSASRDSSNPNNDSTKLKKYIQDSITKKGMNGAAEIAAMMESYRNNPPKTLDGIAVAQLLDYELQLGTHFADGSTFAIDLPKSNVLQFVLADGSIISARPSGTEPKIKFYFSVNSSLLSADQFDATALLLDQKMERLQKELQLS